MWTNRHDGEAEALAVDASGNVFVTGGAWNGPSYDFATFAYSSGGVALWTNRYDGWASGNDGGVTVAADANGNVYITGDSLEPGWERAYDYPTIAYSSAGEPLWVNHFTEMDSGHHPPHMAVDSAGNVVVLCQVTRSGIGTWWVTSKYSSDGSPLWSNPYDGPADSSDWPTGLAVDASDSVYVSGWSQLGLTIICVTVKYSSAGVPLWTNRYQGIMIGRDGGAVVVDSSGKVYVTGTFWSGVHHDYATIAYSSEMVPLWTNRYNGPGNGEDIASGIAVDADGNVVVTGTSVGRGSSDYRTVVTIKYSNTGVPLWTNRCDGTAVFEDYLNYPDDFFALDAIGNVFITGISAADGNITIAYSSAGVPLWTNKFDGAPSALAVDPSGNVYVAGGGTVVKYAAVGPSLSISLVGSQVRIAWPSSATGWVVRRASVVAGPYNDPGLSVSSEGSESVAYDNLGTGTGFYCLQREP